MENQVFFVKEENSYLQYFVTCMNGKGYYYNDTILGSFHYLKFDDGLDIKFKESFTGKTERINYSDIVSMKPCDPKTAREVLIAIKK